MDLQFFDSRKLKKSKVRKIVDQIASMPKDKAVSVEGKPTKLKSLKSVLYNEHPGKFRIYDKQNKIIVKWKQ